MRRPGRSSPIITEAGRLPAEAMPGSWRAAGVGAASGSWEAAFVNRHPSGEEGKLSPAIPQRQLRARPQAATGRAGARGPGAGGGEELGSRGRARGLQARTASPPRTDLPGGAVPQHDDFHLPVLALLLRVRHAVPGTRTASPPLPEVQEGRAGGGSGRGERRKGGCGSRTPRPGRLSHHHRRKPRKSLAGRHLARPAAPHPPRRGHAPFARRRTRPPSVGSNLRLPSPRPGRPIRGPGRGETLEGSRPDAALPTQGQYSGGECVTHTRQENES